MKTDEISSFHPAAVRAEGASGHYDHQGLNESAMNPIKRKVLLVDDDRAMLRIVSKMLATSGYEVRCVQDGLEALAAVEQDCPDFIITDWTMPQLDGLELCQRIRAANLPHYVYLIILTAKTGTDAATIGLEAGADDFLFKPVARPELLARLHAGARVLDLERQLVRLASHDTLTGIPTRRTFYEHFTKEFERARRYHLPLTLAMIDVDFFKTINDSHGHPAGDAVLKVVAQTLQSRCRKSDFVCRYGGEEFCVLMPETSEQQAVIWAERAREALAEMAVTVGGKSLRLTASLGLAERRGDTPTAEKLVDHSDQALLVAKQSGRNRTVTYGALDELTPLSVGRGTNPFDGATALDAMSGPVSCLKDDEAIHRAAEFFCRMRVNAAPVVDADGRLAGILSEKDLLPPMDSPDSWQAPVSTLMKSHVICYDEDTPLRKIFDFLCRVSIRRVVVVRDGRPVGVIGRDDLLRWHHQWMEARGLLRSDADSADSWTDCPTRREVKLTASALAEEASRLRDCLCRDLDELLPAVAHGASEMQRLLDRLQVHSRLADAVAQ